ncbi:MAG: DUF4129 domain-containing protein [Thermoleophilia bacterium]
MFARWLDRLLLPALAVSVETLWLAPLVAVSLHVAVGEVFLVAAAIMGMAAGLAVAVRRSKLSAAQARRILVLLALALTAVFGYAAWRLAVLPLAAAVVVSLLGSSAVLWLGLYAGRLALTPEAALMRGARSLLLVSLLALTLHESGGGTWHAGIVLAATLVVALALVALARLNQVLMVASNPAGIRKGVWLTSVLFVAAAVVAAAAVFAALLDGGVLHLALSYVASVAHLLLDVVGYALGLIAYVILKPVAWLGGLLHLHFTSISAHVPPAPHVTLPVAHKHGRSGAPAVVRDLAIAVGVALVAGLAAWILARSVKKFGDSGEAAVREDRETLVTASEAFRSVGRRLGAALRQARPARRTPELVLRHEFALLEKSLAAAGQRRASSETARHYLHAIAAEADQNQRDPATEIDVLLELYERARYSEQEIHWDEVAHFKSLRKNWVATLHH